MFNGEQVIYPEFLKETGRTSQYKADDGSIHQEDRDACKYWQRGNVRISLVGLENQVNRIDYMPHRIIGYDGASYRSQILGEKPYELYPVITLVLYFGFTHWDKPLSVFDEMDVSDNIRPFVNDYKVNLFEIAFLKPEQVQMFKSDFREVADYFVQKRTNKNYRPSKRTITHVDEFLKFMAALSGGQFMKALTGVDENGKPAMYHLGHFFFVVDPDAFMGREEFKKIAGDICRALRASKLAPGQDRIYTAGEKEYETWLFRKDKGVPVGEAVQKDIIKVRDELGLPYKFPFEN